MEQDKDKKSTGAPSTDTTSALFVSARKKQLEQQEEERRAQQREAERRAAEEEVRRLEQEVAERKRRTEEEARRVEEEAIRVRAQAAAAQRQAASAPPAPSVAQPPAAGPLDKLTQNAAKVLKVDVAANRANAKKVQLILAGVAAAAVVLVVVVVILAISLGKGAAPVSYDTKSFTGSLSTTGGLSMRFPQAWQSGATADANSILLSDPEDRAQVAVMDLTALLQQTMGDGGDMVDATESLLYTFVDNVMAGMTVPDFTPSIRKAGESVEGTADFQVMSPQNTPLNVAVRISTQAGARTILSMYAVDNGKDVRSLTALCEAILSTLMVGDPGDAAQPDGAGDTAAAGSPVWVTSGDYTKVYSAAAGVGCYVPKSWSSETVSGGDFDRSVLHVVAEEETTYLYLLDCSAEYQAVVVQNGGTMKNLVDFLAENYFLSDDLKIGTYYDATEQDNGAVRSGVELSGDGGPMYLGVDVNTEAGTALLFLAADEDGDDQAIFNNIVASAEIVKG